MNARARRRLDEYLQYLASERRLSPHTRSNYQRDLGLLAVAEPPVDLHDRLVVGDEGDVALLDADAPERPVEVEGPQRVGAGEADRAAFGRDGRALPHRGDQVAVEGDCGE